MVGFHGTYHAIIGLPGYAKFMAIPNYTYLKLKMPGLCLTVALVLSAVHHRRVLPLMSRPLRMDEMGPGVSSRDLEACRMSNEPPADDEVAARVRAAVAGDF